MKFVKKIFTGINRPNPIYNHPPNEVILNVSAKSLQTSITTFCHVNLQIRVTIPKPNAAKVNKKAKNADKKRTNFGLYKIKFKVEKNNEAEPTEMTIIVKYDAASLKGVNSSIKYAL